MIAAVRRMWLVAVAGLVITLAVVWIVRGSDGVYWSEVRVDFLLPQTDANPNSLQFTSESLIATAGLVEKIVTGSGAGPSPVSDEVTLAGQGVRHGYSVRLPNSGGQWASNFDRPVLDVQAVGGSPAEVRITMNHALGDIEDTLASIQDDMGVAPPARVGTRLVPAQPPVFYAGGSRPRAVAAVLVLGTLVTVAAAVFVDHLRRTRQVVSPGSAEDAAFAGLKVS